MAVVMKTLWDVEQSRDFPELNIDKHMSIRKALRVMIDNRKYSATVIDENEEPFATVNVKSLREALSLGYSSSTSLEELLLGTLISNMFFSKNKDDQRTIN
jgi:hypothetical protein